MSVPQAYSSDETGDAAGGSTQAGKSASQQLTVVVLTLNEEQHISDCIASLRWADRVVAFDAFSEDRTVALARHAGAEVVQSEFHNYAQQRNAALDQIKTGWVFFVDADERATPELGAEIREVTTSRSEAGWYVPRDNYIFGRLTRGAGWYPDYQLRLFRHGRVHYERPVHEVAVVNGDVGYLECELTHYNYETTEQFHCKQRRYSDYDARILVEQGVRPKFYTPLTQMVRHFWWRFLSLRGYQDGLHGLRLSAYMAYYEWLKYRKLAQLSVQATAVAES
jgi:glycosyltransferase involved in cell wall biosynthesis